MVNVIGEDSMPTIRLTPGPQKGWFNPEPVLISRTRRGVPVVFRCRCGINLDCRIIKWVSHGRMLS
ncbi:MAG: hypothetical protein IRY89_16540 [Pseudolabrys sp.]|nr:hypothetical protein [Pseudolabrys sp.]